MKKEWMVAAALSGIFAACGKKTEETRPIRKDVTETVFASGILEAKNTYSLTAKADGYLQAINFEEGDLVGPGKILAVVDNKESGFNSESAAALYEIAKNNARPNAPTLLQAQNAVALDKQKTDQDFEQYQRYKKLWEKNSVARADYENAQIQYAASKTAYDNAVENYRQLQIQAGQQAISAEAVKNVNRTALDANHIKAVVGGKVYKKYKQAGDYVKRGDVIALIGDAAHIYAKVNVDESNIGKVKPGQPAVVQLNVDKMKSYKGTISEISPSFDEASQSFICKLNSASPWILRLLIRSCNRILSSG